MYTLMYPCPQSGQRTFLSPQKLPRALCSQFLVLQHPSTPGLQAITDLTSNTKDSFYLFQNFIKWNHVADTLLCLASFAQHNGFEIIRVAYTSSSFLSIAESQFFIYYNWFIHLSVDGHLSCLQFGGIVNESAISIHLQVFVWFMFLLFLRRIQE